MTRWIGAIVAGLFLATLPYWRYLPLGGPVGAHMDHEPHHGGQLGMFGDHHIEVVRRRGRMEVFVSDAARRSLRPSAVSVRLDRHAEIRLEWRDHRFVAADESDATLIEVRVAVAEGAEFAGSFDFSTDNSG